MKNKDIREALKVNGVKHWELADYLGIHENTFVRRLRKELPDTEKQRIFEAIKKLSKEEK
ncbi:hypothetical protein [Acetobacterium sp.]|uniref:hypothetical protein n=1 Tax=Acetobacterium sp. TaxID=1872094 RepID=UPI0027171BC1|nr:hypothetical protein [Acetobacterium sp.]MDO9491113.1 hypothetical protein [Acetobacterium sp.]